MTAPDDGEAVPTPPESVYLKAETRRNTHALVVGSPGSGKSKFLEHMIREDIRSGQGLCLIDIHGSLFQAVKRWCAFHYFLDRPVVLIDPSAGSTLPGFNPFQPRAGIALDVQVNSMVQALLRVWGASDTTATPTLDRVLRLLFSAMVARGMPLHEAFGLVNYGQKDLRNHVIEAIDHPAVKMAWQELAAIASSASRSQWREEVLSTYNRLYPLVTSDRVRQLTGLTTASLNIDTLSLMNEGAVVLVNLAPSGDLSREAGKAMAALLLNDFFQTAVACRGEDKTGVKPEPFYIYLDEWQKVATPDIEFILAEARKFGLNLVLANQDLAQIEQSFGEPFLRTLLTCCRIKACFGGLNGVDARRMAEEMFLGPDAINLDETKYILEATKFWPQYSRDKVFSQSTARASSSGSATVLGSGASTHEMFMSESGLFGPGFAADAVSLGEGMTNSESVASSSSESYVSGEAVADVPILLPVPFKEMSSRTTFSLEEQIYRWAGRLHEQFQRHCFLKMPGETTLPLRVPFVKERFIDDDDVAEYEEDVARETGARTFEEIEALLEEQHKSTPKEPESPKEAGSELWEE